MSDGADDRTTVSGLRLVAADALRRERVAAAENTALLKRVDALRMLVREHEFELRYRGRARA